MSEETKDYFYRRIDELLHKDAEEQSVDDVLYLLRALLDEL